MSYGGDDRGPTLNAVCWTFNGVAIFVVILRQISPDTIFKPISIDDAFAILAALVNAARGILLSVAVGEGYGKHMMTLPPSNLLSSLRLAVIIQAVGVWTWTLPKLAVVALLQRIFVPSIRHTILLYAPAVILVIFSLVLTITTFAQCTPIEKNWNRLIPEGSCWSPNVNLDLGYFAGALSVTLDFAYALYPMLQVSKLQMSRRKKVIVCASLGLGFIAAISTIYKLTLISEIGSTEDITWGTAPLEVWNSIEGNLLVIAASIPVIKPFLRATSQHWLSFSSRWLMYGSKQSTSQATSSAKRASGALGFDESTKGPVSSTSHPRRNQWHQLDDEGDESDGIPLAELR